MLGSFLLLPLYIFNSIIELHTIYKFLKALVTYYNADLLHHYS